MRYPQLLSMLKFISFTKWSLSISKMPSKGRKHLRYRKNKNVAKIDNLNDTMTRP